MNDGTITSNGVSGGAAFCGGTGGGSGGGSINLFYKTNISEGTITATGGAGGGNLGYDAPIGGYGGTGSVTITDI